LPDKEEFWESAMAEFGEVFDYQLSAFAFEYLTSLFMGVYGFAIIWMSVPDRRLPSAPAAESSPSVVSISKAA
jgi:hypothetical protein